MDVHAAPADVESLASLEHALPKRKAAELEPEPDKRRKLEQAPSTPFWLKSCAGLPPQLWQRIFSVCSPATLGRLLQVNRPFHSYLTRVSPSLCSKPSFGSGCSPLLPSETVWSAVRAAHFTKPPKPLKGFSELRMWQLTGNLNCQFCSRTPRFAPDDNDWQKGPGQSGVRTVWTFGLRACGNCLIQRCDSESVLLFSPASALRSVLPCVFITSDWNVITAGTIQNSNLPASVEVTKYYLRDRVQSTVKAFEDVQRIGSDAAEKWFEDARIETIEWNKAADEWERWEVTYRSLFDHPAPRSGLPGMMPSLPASHPVPHGPPNVTSFHAPPQSALLAPSVHARGERSYRDANEAKANRKMDIERRCRELHAPIPPNVLRHMDSFKAAIQIPQPMTDHAWTVLWPRLLSQLEAAEQTEMDHARVASFRPRASERRNPDPIKDSKDVVDREWEDEQTTVRDRLGMLADGIIEQHWAIGRSVTNKTSSKFAADVLTQVRQKYYDSIANDEAAQRTEQMNSSSFGPLPKRKLVLENMKWVFDNKVKPLTEPFRKDLFLCSGSGCENMGKYYGFEGVVQHYGAKHTTAFTVGNVIVHWREAEWPEEPPFARNAPAPHHPSTRSGRGRGGRSLAPFRGGYSRPNTSTGHLQAPAPHAGPSPFPNQTGLNFPGPFPPPNGHGATPMNVASQAGPASLTSAAHNQTGMVHPGNAFKNTSSSAQGSTRNGPVAEARSNMNDAHVASLVGFYQDMWRMTSDIQDLPNNLRIHVLLQQVLFRFRAEFNQAPTLQSCIDALTDHRVPKALKYLPGLRCKVCQANFVEDLASSDPSQADRRPTLSLLGLLAHFQGVHSHRSRPGTAHGNGQPTPSPDWMENITELPDDRIIMEAFRAPGMDDRKLRMFTDAFPAFVPPSSSRTGAVARNDRHSTSRFGLEDPRKARTSNAALPDRMPSYARAAENGFEARRFSNRDQSTLAVDPSPGDLHASPSRDDRRPYFVNEHVRYLPRQGPVEEDVDFYDCRPGRPCDGQVFHDPGMHYVHDGYSVVRGRDTYLEPIPREIVYTRPRTGYSQEVYAYPPDVRYREAEIRRPETYPYGGGGGRSQSPLPTIKLEAGSFADNNPTRGHNALPIEPPGTRTGLVPPSNAELEVDDGSRYTPPPVVPPHSDATAEGFGDHVATRTAMPTMSSGPNVERTVPHKRQAPSPEPAGRIYRSTRPKIQRREVVPSRYYRYVAASHENDYSRTHVMHRSHSRGFSRYDEQRRRIEDQESSQPPAETAVDPKYGHDSSVDPRRMEEPRVLYSHPPPQEYVPIGGGSAGPVRYRYAESPRDSAFVGEYGRPIHEYEIVQVRDAAPRRPMDPYWAPAPERYGPELDPERARCTTYAYEGSLPPRSAQVQFSGAPSPYGYYEPNRPRGAVFPEEEAGSTRKDSGSKPDANVEA